MLWIPFQEEHFSSNRKKITAVTLREKICRLG